MSTKESTRNLFQRIQAVMSRVTALEKSEKAPRAAGGYAYVSHDQVTEFLRPLLAEEGVVVLPTVREYTMTGAKGDVTVKIDLTLVNADSPEERETVTFFASAPNNGGKGAGAAYSYAVKYGLSKLFQISSGEDLDALESATRDRKVGVPKSNGKTDSGPSSEGLRKLAELAADVGEDLEVYTAENFGVKPPSLSRDQFADTVEVLKARKNGDAN